MRSWTVLLLAAAALSACTTGARGSRRPRTSDPVTGDPSCPPTARPEAPVEHAIPGTIPGTPSIRIVWEALYGEQEQSRNAKYRLTGMDTFGQPDLEVVLLNASFVATAEQDRDNRSQTAVGRLARVPDQDMIDLVRNLERMGFFKYAQPTGAVRPYFASERARGRITVERGGESVTLVSLRGLGLQDATKAIPGIYAQAKTAIQILKNRTPAMSAKAVKVDPLQPKSGKDGSSSGTPKPTSGGGGK